MLFSKLCVQCLLNLRITVQEKKIYEELLSLDVQLIQVGLNKTQSPSYVLSDFELSFMKLSNIRVLISLRPNGVKAYLKIWLTIEFVTSKKMPIFDQIYIL